MKLSFAIFFALFFSNTIFAGTEIQNGGGGISINGEVATFYSAELKIYPNPIDANVDFKTLERSISKLTIPNRAKMELIKNITPSFKRRYYSVDERYVDTTLINTIKGEYSRVTNIPTENLTIFALTDPKTQITLLLPDFFKLMPAEKRTILLHESLWINNRVPDYKTMLEIDKAAQIYFEYPHDCESATQLVEKFETIFNERLWSLGMAFACEMNEYINISRVPQVSFLDLIGTENVRLLAELLYKSSRNIPASLEQVQLSSSLSNDQNGFFFNTRLALSRELTKSLLIVTDFTNALRVYLDHNKSSSALFKILLNSNVRLSEINTSTYYIRMNSSEIGDIILTTPDNLIFGTK